MPSKRGRKAAKKEENAGETSQDEVKTTSASVEHADSVEEEQASRDETVEDGKASEGKTDSGDADAAGAKAGRDLKAESTKDGKGQGGDKESSTDATTTDEDPIAKAKARREKFRQLKMKMNQSSSENKQELFAEYRRQKIDPAAVARLERKKADAELELSKIEASEQGEDFERKRAWDWTIEETEKWNERMERKKQAKQNSVLADFSLAADRAYQRELRELQPDKEAYLRQKTKSIEKSGQIVEGENGKLIAVDDDRFDSAHSLDFTSNKPPKEAVDRLVNSIKKADQQRMRKAPKTADEDGALAINEKNKHFNKKLSRYYDKYTKEIRDSFERGTAL